VTSVPCPGYPRGCTCHHCQTHYIRCHANSETYAFTPGDASTHDVDCDCKGCLCFHWANEVEMLLAEIDRLKGRAYAPGQYAARWVGA
jgi:hypothetical protein